MRILVVEDSATLRQGMKKMIKEIGHSSLFANSGEEALQMVGVNDFDLVIMDIEMPGLDGFETTSLMREALGDRWVPIIFSTSHTGDDNVLAGIEAGGDDYLIKPVSRQLLEAKIKAMHRIAQMQQQLTQLNHKLEALSQYDGLTQLFNRNTFIDKASQSLTEARRHLRPCSLLMLDVDFFKQYNDSYGHVSGDQCLQRISQALKSSIKRESDIVGRYGGEEFIIALPHTDQRGAKKVATKILEAVTALAIPHNSSIISDYVTISIGIDTAKGLNQFSLDHLLITADKNLYLAKEQGRNKFVISNSDQRTILIADDDEKNLSLLTDIFQTQGNIITADNQKECIELAKDIMPDLILMDIDRHQVNGKTIAEKLKQHMRTARIPLLFITKQKRSTTNKQEVNLTDIDVDSLQEKVSALLD